jgi:FkbM family methyltransferase
MIQIHLIDEDKKKIFYGKEPVIIWGTGIAAECAYNYFKKHGLTQRILGFCDNNIRNCGKDYLGKYVFSYHELMGKKEKIYVLLPGTYQIEIANQILENKNFNIIYAYSFKLKEYEDYSKTWNNLIENNKQTNKKIQLVRNLLKDELSLKTFDYILKARETGDISYFKSIARSPKEQYFDDLITLKKNEVFVDCGAFIGDTIENLLIHNGTDAKIYAFEPEKKHYDLVCRKFYDNENIKVINAGVWDSKTELEFEIDKESIGSSCISKDGKEKIQTETIDNIVKDDKITFIKMDVEGAERQALIGARSQIIRNKPKLAICLYHHPEDIYEIPLLIKEMVPEYNLYIRHYSVCNTETVLYALV